MKEIILSNVRIQFVLPNVIRFENKSDGKFSDSETLFIPSRHMDSGEDLTYTLDQKNKTLVYNDYTFYLPHYEKSINGLKVVNPLGKVVYKYKQNINKGELPLPQNTPEVFAVYDNPRVTVPDGGYTYIGETPDSGYTVTENVDDVYLILCQKDHKLLRRTFVELTGRSELVRLSTLGLWDSRYYVYDENSAKKRISDYEEHNVPLDNLVIDTDWRNAENGMGYDVNEKLFPDIKKVFDFAHEHNVDVIFNDHPEPFSDAKNALSPNEVKYREENLQRLLSLGLDSWWYDRNWRSGLISPTKNIKRETWGMHIYSDITKHFYQKRDGKYHTRPDIMANVSNIQNGSYGGAYGNCNNNERQIADTASHRYSVQWTGDISSDYDSIGKEVCSLLGCGNNCIPYVHPDCGGHTGNPDKETYIRWIEYGAFAPVIRPHCSNTVVRTREPWAYDDETLQIANDYIKMRYRLLPVIYKEAFESYINGYPICRALAFNYPEDKKGVKCKSQYTIGNNLLIAPIANYREANFIPSKYYTSSVKIKYFDGTKWEGEPIYQTEYETLNKYWHLEKPHENVPMFNFSTRSETTLKFDKTVTLCVESDDGVIVYVDGEKVHEDLTLHGVSRAEVCTLEKDKEYNVVVEHFQGGGEAAISLLYEESEKFCPYTRSVYLPEGKWLDAFSGKVYVGGKTVKRNWTISEMPLFIRLGALIPLVYNDGNTKAIKWDKLVYDFYPSRTESDEGYLYEDDTKTVAYKYGEYRKCSHIARFIESENAFRIDFAPTEGPYKGLTECDVREVLLKCHLADIKNVSVITVNGNRVSFEKSRRNKTALPFNTDAFAADSMTVSVKFKINLQKGCTVKIYL